MGGKQLGFGDYEQTTAKKRTRCEKFLDEMDQVVPWQALIDLIEPLYPRNSKKGGRPPYLLATMLRIHLMQQWYSLSNQAMEEALIEVPTMHRFAGIDMISDRIPDETTILAFLHLLMKHDLGERCMGGPHNIPSSQFSFSLSCLNRFALMPQIYCTARLLKDGAVPAKHDGRSRLTSQT